MTQVLVSAPELSVNGAIQMTVLLLLLLFSKIPLCNLPGLFVPRQLQV